jgi:hypothetical protein
VFKYHIMKYIHVLPIIMDTARRWNYSLEEAIGISNLRVRSLSFCSNCVDEFGHRGPAFGWVKYTHQKAPVSSKRMSPQSPRSPAYWLRNKRNGRSGLSNWCSHPPDRNQSGHSFGSTYHFGLKFGLKVRKGSYSIVEIQREDTIDSKVLQLACGQVPSVARFPARYSR